jgi:hypothetical protein
MIEHSDPVCVVELKEVRVRTFKPEYLTSPTTPTAAKPSQPLWYDSGMQPHNKYPLFITMLFDNRHKMLYTNAECDLRKCLGAACISHSIALEFANIISIKDL